MKVRVVSVDYASDSGLDGTFVYARSSAELAVVAGRCRPGPCGEWWTFGEPNAILGGAGGTLLERRSSNPDLARRLFSRDERHGCLRREFDQTHAGRPMLRLS